MTQKLLVRVGFPYKDVKGFHASEVDPTIHVEWTKEETPKILTESSEPKVNMA